MLSRRFIRASNGRTQIHLKRLWAPVFMMVGISILSGSAGIQSPGWSFVGIDKLGHLVVFGLLGIAWARCFAEDNSALIYAVLLATAFGLADETHQYHNPQRMFEWLDLLADFCGALLASLLYLRVGPLQSLLEVKIGRVLRLRSRGNPAN